MLDDIIEQPRLRSVKRSLVDVKKQLSRNTNVSLYHSMLIYKLDLLINASRFVKCTYPISHTRGLYFQIKLGILLNTRQIEDEVKLYISKLNNQATLGYFLPVSMVNSILLQYNLLLLDSEFTFAHGPLMVFIEFFQKYISSCRREIGLWIYDTSMSDLEYTYRIKYETSLDLSAVQIHNIGLRQLAISTSTLSSIQKQNNPTNRPKYKFSIPGIRVEHVSEPFFPRAVYVPEDNTKKRGAILFINKYHGPFNWSLLVHEVYPGHHFEKRTRTAHGGIFDDWSGYIEGWAVYNEWLYLYKYNKDNLTMKQHYMYMEIVWDIRLIVDTGIHSSLCGKWSMADAGEFYRSGLFRGRKLVPQFSGLPIGYSEIVSELLGIISRPAHSLCYKLGKMCFVFLHNEAVSLCYKEKQVWNWLLSNRVPLNMLPELCPFTTDMYSAFSKDL